MAPRTMCSRCGAYLSAPSGAYLSAPSGARSVRCPLCHAVTRVERRPHGLHHAAVGFFKGLISSIVSPAAHQQPGSLSSASLRPGAAASQLPASYPRVRVCKKRALLVGISYAGTKYELKGSVNDVNCMGFMLRERFKFPSDCILVMTRRQGPGKGADQAQPPASDAVARGGHQLRRLPGVPLLRPRRAEAGHQRRRGGRLRRGALPGGLREPRRHPRRRGQRDHCPAARARRYAARHHRHLPQRNHPRPPLPLPYIQDRVLAMGESQPPVRRAQVHQRRPRHLHQRMRRQPNIARHHGALRLHLDRRHDVQLHQGGGVRPGHHLRPPPHGDEGDHPRQWRRVRHPGAHRHLLPPSHHLQLRAGAPAVRFGTV